MRSSHMYAGMTAFGALGLLVSGPWAFSGPMWPWLAVLLTGALLPLLARLRAGRQADDDARRDDLRAARRALDDTDRRLDTRAQALEARVAGLFTPEQAAQLARDQSAIVARLAEIENQLAEHSTVLEVKRMTGALDQQEPQ